MKFLGLSPSVPTTPVPDTTQPITDTTTAVDDATNQLRRRRGVAATILAGDSAAPTSASVSAPAATSASKALLGQ